MARSLTVISLLFQSTTHCRYRVYTKFLLTYTAIYRRNRKVLPLGITAFQPQSHFHLGTPYTYIQDTGYRQNSDELCMLIVVTSSDRDFQGFFHSLLKSNGLSSEITQYLRFLPHLILFKFQNYSIIGHYVTRTVKTFVT